MLINALLIAFSTYSKIPVPQAKWTEKNMKYSICFFPLIGVVIGALVYGVYYLMLKFEVNEIFMAGVLTSVPVLLTGGIHLDGYLDTLDALSSYGSMEKKQEILRDPHAGVFAIIRCCLFFVLYFAFATLLSTETILFLSLGFVLSRALSGLFLVSFKPVEGSSLLKAFSDSSKKKVVKFSMIFYILVVLVFSFMNNYIYTLGLVVASLIAFIVYIRVAKKQFGGISGDLNGYFLQKCELYILIVIGLLGVIL